MTNEIVDAQALKNQIGAVLCYHCSGTKIAGGQTVGADGFGDYCVIFLGDPEKSENAAQKYVRKLIDNDSTNIITATIVPAYPSSYGHRIIVKDVDNSFQSY